MAAHLSIPHHPDDDHTRLHQFRNELHDCLTTRPDALFELVDGLCQPIPVHGVAHLTLAPGARRGHGSAYAALARGRIDEDLTRDLLAAYRPTGWGADFAVDTTTWPRPDAHCSPGRGFYHHAHAKARLVKGQPIVAGWNLSLLSALSPTSARWTAPLDVRLRAVGEDATTVAVAQVTALLPRLGPHPPQQPLFVFDAGYNPAQLTLDLAGVPVQVAVRVRNDRVFFTRPPQPRDRHGRPGRPQRHGRRFHCAHPESWPTPQDSYTADTDAYGHVDVRAWHHLHPESSGFHDPDGRPSIVECTLIRIKVERLPAGRGENPNTMWLWWAGPPDTTPDLPRVFRAYLHRFRPRAHIQVLQTDDGLDHAEGPHPGTGPTLELAGPGGLHPAPAGPPRRGRPSSALATAPARAQDDARTGPRGFWPSTANPAHTNQWAKIPCPGPRPPQRSTVSARQPLPAREGGSRQPLKREQKG